MLADFVPLVPAEFRREPPAAPAPIQVPSLEQQGIPPGSYDLVPLNNVQRVTAKRLVEAVREIPSFPLTVDLQIDAEARALA